ncbi:type I-E CRISPR-associated protein Cas6/Cse3/CasE [Fontimonas sp. SYSU GA230001]|uniref:type I-E CRISPR-associated protein Cas6/Cse3/CasE n=1 Tax=Fontimonas sp. SYSU GA230001 TaxID=3142450 RepID=UPI0032B45A9D
MYLHRIHLNPRCKEARRDLADPYQMHATLCRAFFPHDMPCPSGGALLWRLEPETDEHGRPRLLIQSSASPDWTRVAPSDWLDRAEPGIDLEQRLALDRLSVGHIFRFRLRANPCKAVQRRRTGLVHPDAQLAWLARKGEQHGFVLPPQDSQDYFDCLSGSPRYARPDVRVSQTGILSGKQHNGNTISVYSVLFEGRLAVSDAAKFKAALKMGIGHGKVMGLGLLSIAPAI